MRLIETIGTLDNIDQISILGIVDANGQCIAVRVIDLNDGQPMSWGMTDRQRQQFSRIVEAIAT